jgi:hypothetical protein
MTDFLKLDVCDEGGSSCLPNGSKRSCGTGCLYSTCPVFVVNNYDAYYDSDAWVLLAIVYANRSGHGTLDQIIAAGDAINVAIFLPNELEGGLARLTAGGYVSEYDGTFAPTVKAFAYSKSSRNRRTMLQELKDVQRMLASRSAEPPKNTRYPGFSEASYSAAVEKYRCSIRSGA